jgi:superoxide reductase
MPKINYATEVSAEMKEAKRDYLDRHTPHVEAPASVKKGEPFLVTVKMGQDYVHPDLDNHHIQRLQLFNGDRLLASTEYEPGAFTAGMEEAKGFSRAIFQIALEKPGRLTAMSYCTLHGLWMSEEVSVVVG